MTADESGSFSPLFLPDLSCRSHRRHCSLLPLTLCGAAITVVEVKCLTKHYPVALLPGVFYGAQVPLRLAVASLCSVNCDLRTPSGIRTPDHLLKREQL